MYQHQRRTVKHDKHGKRVLVTIIGLVLVAVTAACGSFLFWEHSSIPTNCEEHPAWMPIPEQATRLSERCVMSFNPTYETVFRLPPEALEAFQTQTRITEWQSDPAAVTTFEQEAAGMESLLFGEFGNGAVLTHVLVDTSNPQEYTVYLRNTFVD